MYFINLDSPIYQLLPLQTRVIYLNLFQTWLQWPRLFIVFERSDHPDLFFTLFFNT
jgi:hypothetical protein